MRHVTPLSVSEAYQRLAGVVGLTTALEIQQRGNGKYRVTLVADAYPGDPDTGVRYTSQWAVRASTVDCLSFH